MYGQILSLVLVSAEVPGRIHDFLLLETSLERVSQGPRFFFFFLPKKWLEKNATDVDLKGFISILYQHTSVTFLIPNFNIYSSTDKFGS